MKPGKEVRESIRMEVMGKLRDEAVYWKRAYRRMDSRYRRLLRLSKRKGWIR